MRFNMPRPSSASVTVDIRMPHNGIIKMLGCGIDRDARLTPCDDLETQTEEAEEQEEWSWSWCPSVITMQLSVTIKTATTQKFN